MAATPKEDVRHCGSSAAAERDDRRDDAVAVVDLAAVPAGTATADGDGASIRRLVRDRRGSRAAVAYCLSTPDASVDRAGHATEAAHRTTGMRMESGGRRAVASDCCYWLRRMAKRQSPNCKDPTSESWQRNLAMRHPLTSIAAVKADGPREAEDVLADSCQTKARGLGMGPWWDGGAAGMRRNTEPAGRASLDDSTWQLKRHVVASTF